MNNYTVARWALLTGALVWGLIWYPYRALAEAGLPGVPATLGTYGVALLLALPLFPAARREVLRGGFVLLAMAVAAGWTNLSFVVAMIHGEVMRVLLLFYLAPVWTVIFARALLAERLPAAGYPVMALSLCGAVVMLWPEGGGIPLPSGWAEWLGLSSGAGFALTNVLVRRAHAVSVPAKCIAICVGGCAVALAWTLGAGAAEVSFSAPALGYVVLVGMVLFAVNLAVPYGLTHTPANQAIVIFLFEVVVAAVSSYWLAGERLEANEWAGGIMIIAAAFLSERVAPAASDC